MARKKSFASIYSMVKKASPKATKFKSPKTKFKSPKLKAIKFSKRK